MDRLSPEDRSKTQALFFQSGIGEGKVGIVYGIFRNAALKAEIRHLPFQFVSQKAEQANELLIGLLYISGLQKSAVYFQKELDRSLLDCLLPYRIFAFEYTTSGTEKLLSAPFLPLAEVLLNGIFPVLIQRCVTPDGGHSLAHYLVVEAGALAVAVVVYRPVGGNAKMARCLYRVDVGPQEEKLPAVLFLLPLDHLLHSLSGVAATGVLHAVGGDNEKGVLWHILGPSILMDVADMVDGPADGIQQGGAAPDIVLFLRDRIDIAHLHPVMEHLGPVIEEDGGDKGLARLLLLFFNHGVESADGVVLQPLHGTAAVQDEHQFRQILLHKKSPYAVLFGLQAQYRGILIWIGRPAGDKLLCFKQGDLRAVLFQEPEKVLGFEPYGGGIVIGVHAD